MAAERFKISLEGEPANCHALEMAPAKREAILDRGLWLILVFPVWSDPDRKAIEAALDLAKTQGEKLQIGVRPFDKKEELASWCPEAKREWASPTWLILKDGILTHQMFGPQSPKDVREILDLHLRTH